MRREVDKHLDITCCHHLWPLWVEAISQKEEALVIWDVMEINTDVQLDVLPQCQWPLLLRCWGWRDRIPTAPGVAAWPPHYNTTGLQQSGQAEPNEFNDWGAKMHFSSFKVRVYLIRTSNILAGHTLWDDNIAPWTTMRSRKMTTPWMSVKIEVMIF